MVQNKEQEQKINKEVAYRSMKINYDTLQRFRKYKPYVSMNDDETLNMVLDKVDAMEKEKESILPWKRKR